ncbi:MAG: hypothetical protein QOE64_1876 [Frankiales bacterium]|jgi:hypothetical protein|nr:hypothetical protein [Frankiales bacterium]
MAVPDAVGGGQTLHSEVANRSGRTNHGVGVEISGAADLDGCSHLKAEFPVQ